MESGKKKILVFIDWYLPGFKAGGPIKSCVGFVEQLRSRFKIKVVTGDTDLHETVPYSNVVSDSWNTLEDGTEVFYCSRKSKNFSAIRKIIESEKPDIIYLNSMFSRYFTLVPLRIMRRDGINAKVFVAPRGMLSKGALALKPVKKKLFLSAARMAGLFNGITFHASSEIEMREIRDVFGNEVKVKHAMNLVPGSDHQIKYRLKLSSEVSLAYLGRISEVKNLLTCLRLLKKTNPENHFIFDVYGPEDDSGYIDKCKSEIESMPHHVKVKLMGGIDNTKIHNILSKYHFLFLLSMNENFGHAIVEGLSAGCPVIISNRTPWHNLNEKHCGWDLDLADEGSIVAVLNRAAAMEQDEYNKWSESAYRMAGSIHKNQKAIQDHIDMFES